MNNSNPARISVPNVEFVIVAPGVESRTAAGAAAIVFEPNMSDSKVEDSVSKPAFGTD